MVSYFDLAINMLTIHLYFTVILCIVPSSAVREVMTSSPTSTSILVSWRVPISDNLNGDLTHYTVTYHGEEIDTEVRIIRLNTSSHNDMNLTLTNLEEFTIYSINISVYTVIGRGPDYVVSQRTIQDGEFFSLKCS